MKKVLLLGAVMLVAACGSSSSSSNATSSTAGGTAYRLVTKTTLSGTALSDPEGFTLYMFKSDSAGAPTCTGSCASTWPAEASSASLPNVSGLSGTFASVATADGGTQLTYDGWPLYRYSGDKASADANGQGIGGVWFAVTASTSVNPGAAASGATAAPAATSAAADGSSSSSYNYYN